MNKESNNIYPLKLLFFRSKTLIKRSSVLRAADATLSDSDGQSNVDAAAAIPLEPEQRQSRSLSIIARALGKGLDARRPSTVAAVFAAATSLAPTRWSRRASSIKPSSERVQDDDDASSRPSRSTANSVSWKDAGNSVSSDQRLYRNPDTMPDTRQSVEDTRGKQLND